MTITIIQTFRHSCKVKLSDPRLHPTPQVFTYGDWNWSNWPPTADQRVRNLSVVQDGSRYRGLGFNGEV